MKKSRLYFCRREKLEEIINNSFVNDARTVFELAELERDEEWEAKEEKKHRRTMQRCDDSNRKGVLGSSDRKCFSN